MGRDPTMSAELYRRVREKELRLSRDKLAEIVGVSPRTIANRELGSTPITPEANYALRYVVLESLYDLTGVFDEW